MKKPIILLYTNVYETTAGQGIAYMDFFSQFGDVLLVTPHMNLDMMIQLGDILALPGGMDLNPLRYNDRPSFQMRTLNAHYEYLDQHLLKPWINTGKPIIGICRGMQTLNVTLGGTLYTHIDGHVQADKHERWETPEVMYTEFKNDKGAFTDPIVKINSYHHQAVKDVAPGFKILGWSDLDGVPLKKVVFKAHSFNWDIKNHTYTQSKYKRPMVPEIMIHETLPYVAFQYHPEEFNCQIAIDLITEKLEEYANSKETTEEKEVRLSGMD